MDHGGASFIPRLLPAFSVTSCTYVTGRLWRSYEHNYRTMQAFRGPIETADCSKRTLPLPKSSIRRINLALAQIYTTNLSKAMQLL